jgi:hypothetical protein
LAGEKCAVINDPRGRAALEEAVAIVGDYHDAYRKRRLALWLTIETLCGLSLLGSVGALLWVPQAIASRTGNISYAGGISALLVVLAAVSTRMGCWATRHRRHWRLGRERPPVFPADLHRRYRRRRLAASFLVEAVALLVVLSPLWGLALFLALGIAPLGAILLGDGCLLIGALGAVPALRRAHHRRRSWQI